jgi:hypothetical protein
MHHWPLVEQLQSVEHDHLMHEQMLYDRCCQIELMEGRGMVVQKASEDELNASLEAGSEAKRVQLTKSENDDKPEETHNNVEQTDFTADFESKPSMEGNVPSHDLPAEQLPPVTYNEEQPPPPVPVAGASSMEEQMAAYARAPMAPDEEVLLDMTAPEAFDMQVCVHAHTLAHAARTETRSCTPHARARGAWTTPDGSCRGSF